MTGATPDFVRVQLRDGSVGYVPQSAVALFRPADKTFVVSTNTGVYAGPHLGSSKLDSVRRGQNVHVIGVELYLFKNQNQPWERRFHSRVCRRVRPRTNHAQ